MTDDELQMTKEVRSPMIEGRSGVRSPDSALGFRYSFGFRHSSFVFQKRGSWKERAVRCFTSGGRSDSGLTRSLGDTVRVARAAQRRVVADLTAAIDLVKAVIHQHHSVPRARLDAILQLVQVVFADQIADGAGGDEELIGQH